MVDDASPEPLPDLAGATVVRRTANGGFGSAVNSGAAAATGDLLLVLNSDLAVDRDFVALLLAGARAWLPAVVSPRVVDPDGVEEWTGRRSRGSGTRSRSGWCRWPAGAPRPSGTGSWATKPPSTGVRDRSDWVVGAAMLMPLADFRAVGGFDEAFFMNAEEIDLQRRLRQQRGLPSVVLAEPVVTHLGGGSTVPSRGRAWLVDGRMASTPMGGGRGRLRAARAGRRWSTWSGTWVVRWPAATSPPGPLPMPSYAFSAGTAPTSPADTLPSPGPVPTPGKRDCFGEIHGQRVDRRSQSHGGARRLPTLLESLRGQTITDVEMIVVLDGEVDGSAGRARAATDLPVSLVAFPENRGRAAALNAGFGPHAGTCWSARTTTSGSSPTSPSTTGACTRTAGAAWWRCAATSSRTRRTPGPTAGTPTRRSGRRRSPPAGAHLALVVGQRLTTREDHELVGEYDESFREYGWEDIDWGYRLHRLGVPIVVPSGFTTLHHGPVTTTVERALRAYSRARPGTGSWASTGPTCSTRPGRSKPPGTGWWPARRSRDREDDPACGRGSRPRHPLPAAVDGREDGRVARAGLGTGGVPARLKPPRRGPLRRMILGMDPPARSLR